MPWASADASAEPIYYPSNTTSTNSYIYIDELSILGSEPTQFHYYERLSKKMTPHYLTRMVRKNKVRCYGTFFTPHDLKRGKLDNIRLDFNYYPKGEYVTDTDCLLLRGTHAVSEGCARRFSRVIMDMLYKQECQLLYNKRGRKLYDVWYPIDYKPFKP